MLPTAHPRTAGSSVITYTQEPTILFEGMYLKLTKGEPNQAARGANEIILHDTHYLGTQGRGALSFSGSEIK